MSGIGRRRSRTSALTGGITRNVVALGVVSLLTDISSEMLLYVVPLFLANVLATSPAIIGLIEGAAEATASLLKLASGAISDRIRRRRLLIGIGYGASVAAKGLYLVATAWPMVFAARLGDRFGKGIRTAPRDALIADSTAPASRGRAFGLHRAMDTLGAVVGVAAAAIIVTVLQGDADQLEEGVFRALVLAALIPGILAIATILIAVRDVPRSTAATPHAARRPRSGRRFPRPFWLFVAATCLFTLGNSSDAFLALRSQQLGVAVRDLLLVVVVFNLTNTVIAWPSGALSDRIGRRGLIALAWIVYAVAYGGFALAGSAVAVVPLWILYGAYYGITEAAGRALVADLAPEDLRATAFGIVNAAVGVMILPASLIAGILWDRVAPAAPFWFGAGCAAAAVVLLLLAVPGDRHRAAAAA